MKNKYSKKLLAGLEKLTKIGFWELDLTNDSLFWSVGVYDIFEVKKSSRINYELFFNIVHKNDRKKVSNAFLKQIGKKKHKLLTYRIVTPSNKIKYIQEMSYTVFDKNKKAIKKMGTLQDVTELVVSKIKLKEDVLKLKVQQDELQTIFDTSVYGLAVVDTETKFLKVNKKYCELTGLSEEELLQTSCLELTSPEYKETSKENFKNFLETGYIEPCEKSCLIKGKTIHVSLTFSRLPNKKQILANISDISRETRLQEQQRLVSLGDLLGNIAHQWRQPLNIITTTASFVQYLYNQNNLQSTDINKNMTQIIEQATYLSETIENFTSFVKEQDSLERLSFKKVLIKALSILEPIIKANSFEIVLDLSEDLEIDGFENELMQSFINIFNNSIEALQKDELLEEGKKRIIFIKTLKSDKEFIVEIKDSGRGIDKDIINRVMEPYFTTKHQSLGAGIGLYITYNTLQKYKAKLSLNNVEFIYENKNYFGLLFRVTFSL